MVMQEQGGLHEKRRRQIQAGSGANRFMMVQGLSLFKVYLAISYRNAR